MIRPDRLVERMDATEVSQASLARRVGLSQQAVGKLVNGRSRTSGSLHKIARELRTTPAYLSGETDDPDEGAPPPPVSTQILNHVMLPVALPSEAALARMFEGLLAVVDLSAPTDELARELAQLLPTGLTQVRGRAIDLVPAPPPRREEVAEALATVDRGRPR